MATQAEKADPVGAKTTTKAAPVAVNEIRLVGRVSATPESRELPSGDTLWSLRLVVEREEGASRTRQRVDTLDCAVWSARPQRTVAGWRAGDVVEVHGAVRRRFYRTGTGAASRVEIEVARARLIRRATT